MGRPSPHCAPCLGGAGNESTQALQGRVRRLHQRISAVRHMQQRRRRRILLFLVLRSSWQCRARDRVRGGLVLQRAAAVPSAHRLPQRVCVHHEERLHWLRAIIRCVRQEVQEGIRWQSARTGPTPDAGQTGTHHNRLAHLAQPDVGSVDDLGRGRIPAVLVPPRLELIARDPCRVGGRPEPAQRPAPLGGSPRGPSMPWRGSFIPFATASRPAGTANGCEPMPQERMASNSG
jgi:hypothetical protein